MEHRCGTRKRSRSLRLKRLDEFSLSDAFLHGLPGTTLPGEDLARGLLEEPPPRTSQHGAENRGAQNKARLVPQPRLALRPPTFPIFLLQFQHSPFEWPTAPLQPTVPLQDGNALACPLPAQLRVRAPILRPLPSLAPPLRVATFVQAKVAVVVPEVVIDRCCWSCQAASLPRGEQPQRRSGSRDATSPRQRACAAAVGACRMRGPSG